MFGNLLGKLSEARKMVEETKKKLDGISVEGRSGNGEVKVTVTGNRKIISLAIEDRVMQPETKNSLEALVILAANDALEKAEKIYEAEMKNAAKGILPNIPGLF